MESVLKWHSGMSFDAQQDGYTVGLDAAAEFGGAGRGPKPKTLLLTALGGCTGMDVVSILQKMRVPFEGLEIRVNAELTADHPKVFTGIDVHYVFTGRDLPMEKLEHAVRLSQEKYCGVTAMLAKACPIRYDILVQAP